MEDGQMVSDVGRIMVLEKRMAAVEARLGILPDGELWERVGKIEEQMERVKRWSEAVGRELHSQVKRDLVAGLKSVAVRVQKLEKWMEDCIQTGGEDGS